MTWNEFNKAEATGLVGSGSLCASILGQSIKPVAEVEDHAVFQRATSEKPKDVYMHASYNSSLESNLRE